MDDTHFMMTDIEERPDIKTPSNVRKWYNDHSFDILFWAFIYLVAFIMALPIVSNELYHLPVYEMEINGQHRCIGTHQTIDLTKHTPGNASIVRCSDGSVYPNAVNVRYIRLIREGYYFR